MLLPSGTDPAPLCRRESPTRALRSVSLGLYITLLIYKQIFRHLAAPSAGQQSEPFGFAAERVKPTLRLLLSLNTGHPLPATAWQAAPLAICTANSPKGTEAAKYSRGAQQTFAAGLRRLLTKLHLPWTLSPACDVSDILKTPLHFSGPFPLWNLAPPRSLLTTTLHLCVYV